MKQVNGGLFAKHGKKWLPAENLQPAVVTGKSKNTLPHYSGVDHTGVKQVNMSPLYHSGIQAVISGSGEPGEGPVTFDPLKWTLYLDFGKDTQDALGLPSGYGEHPGMPERPVPGGELTDQMKDAPEAEPDERGNNYTPGIEYSITSDKEGVTTWSVVKQPNGRIDTIKYGGNSNGKPIDTVLGKPR